MGAWILILLGVFFATTTATQGNDTQVFKAVDNTNTTGFSFGNITDSSDFFKLVNNSSETVGSMDSHKAVDSNSNNFSVGNTTDSLDFFEPFNSSIETNGNMNLQKNIDSEENGPRHYATVIGEQHDESLPDGKVVDPFNNFETDSGRFSSNTNDSMEINDLIMISDDSMKEIDLIAKNLEYSKKRLIQIFFVVSFALIVLFLVLLLHCNRVLIELRILKKDNLFLTRLRKLLANRLADPFVLSEVYSKAHEKEDADEMKSEVYSEDLNMII